MQHDNTLALEAKENLINELKEIYALVDASGIVLQHEACTEVASLIDITSMARDKLYHVYSSLEAEIKGSSSND